MRQERKLRLTAFASRLRSKIMDFPQGRYCQEVRMPLETEFKAGADDQLADAAMKIGIFKDSGQIEEYGGGIVVHIFRLMDVR